MKILIVGAGGIGGYFGAKLLLAGADITYLLREKRQKLIQDQGLTIETPKGNFTIHPKTVLANQLEPIYDLIILACKAFDLDDSLKSIAKASSNGVILPFLNGLSHLEILDGHFGRERVMGGVAHIAATITPAGSVKQLNDLKRLTVGARSPAHEPLAKAFFSICTKTDFDHAYSDNIEQSLWDKWVFLAALAGITTICRGSIGEIVATPYGRELSRGMYIECCSIADSLGHLISDRAQTTALELLTEDGSHFTSSMLRDLLAAKRSEYGHILGALIILALDAKIDCPLLKIAHTHMAVESNSLG